VNKIKTEVMKVTEIKEMSDKEIIERIDVEKERLLKLRMNHAINPLDNPMQLRHIRRDIAKLKTVLRQRKITKK